MAARKKKKPIVAIFITVTVVALASFGFFLAYLWWQSYEEPTVHYDQFGIDIPRGFEIHGIDVSRYQHNISWTAVANMKVNDVKLGFAFIKATEGSTSRDPKFKRNWEQAKTAGIVRGAYHFFISTRDGAAQAKNFISTVPMLPGDLPPVLDVENKGKASATQLRTEMKEWLDMVENTYHVRPIIYTYVSFYDKYLKGYFDDYPLWVAHYLQPEKPRIGRDWVFWQHSESGHVDGIVHKVDFNVYSGDSASFRSLLIQ